MLLIARHFSLFFLTRTGPRQNITLVCACGLYIHTAFLPICRLTDDSQCKHGAPRQGIWFDLICIRARVSTKLNHRDQRFVFVCPLLTFNVRGHNCKRLSNSIGLTFGSFTMILYPAHATDELIQGKRVHQASSSLSRLLSSS